LKRIVFLTGPPRIGKTTVLVKAVEGLKSLGYKVGGMVSREVREGGVRVGFKIIDLSTGREGWLAHVRQPTGPKISKYRVNLSDLESVGVKSIRDAVLNADVIVIDEVGPMELFSRSFKEAVKTALESGKPLLGTIHYRARDPLINMIKRHGDAEVLEVTAMNRSRLHETIIEAVSASEPLRSRCRRMGSEKH